MKKIKRKIGFYKALLIEIIETLCSICLFLERNARYSHMDANHFRSHFKYLKQFSDELRGGTDENNIQITRRKASLLYADRRRMVGGD